MSKNTKNTETITNKSTLIDKLTLFTAIVAIGISLLTFFQTETLNQTSSTQFQNANKIRNTLVTDLNKAHNDILKENNQKLIEVQTKNNVLLERIQNLQNKQNELFLKYNSLTEEHNDLVKKNNDIKSNYTNVYQEIEKIKKETSESQRLINFISVTSNAMKCDVEKSSDIISYGATELFNTFERNDSKILLLDFLSSLSFSNNSKCHKNITIKLKGLDLNGLNLNGININNLYCENCKTETTNYSIHSRSYKLENLCKKPEKNYTTHKGEKNIALECGWDYKSYRTIDYLDLREK
jgi:hypothetical protein